MTRLWNDANIIDEAIGTHIRGRLFLAVPAFVIGAGITGVGSAIPSPLSPWAIGLGIGLMAAAVGGGAASVVRENALERRCDQLNAG